MYMHVYTYVVKKEGREGVQNGEEEQKFSPIIAVT